MPASTAKLTLNLITEQQTAKDYRQYTYRRNTSFTVVNGVEDNQAKKVLRFNITGTNPDQVEVYVNGVKRERGTNVDQYQLYTGPGSAVPPNTVLFNSAITGGSTQVDVIVSKAAAVNTTTLTFNRAIDDDSRVGTGAWEGINAVSNPVLGQLSLFVCDFEDNESLALDVKLRIDPNNPSYVVKTVGGAKFNVTIGAILLSRSKLYTQVDRQRAKWIPLTALNTETDYLVVKLQDGARTLLATESSATDVFPVLEALRFQPPKILTKNLLGHSEGAELDNELITGPDA